MENLIWLVFLIIIIGNGIAKILKQRSGQKPRAPEENGEEFELPEIFKREFLMPPAVMPQPPKPKVIPALKPAARKPVPARTPLPPAVPVEMLEGGLVEPEPESVWLEPLLGLPAEVAPAPGAGLVPAPAEFEKEALLEGVAMSVILGPPRARSRRLYLLGRTWRPAP